MLNPLPGSLSLLVLLMFLAALGLGSRCALRGAGLWHSISGTGKSVPSHSIPRTRSWAISPSVLEKYPYYIIDINVNLSIRFSLCLGNTTKPNQTNLLEESVVKNLRHTKITKMLPPRIRRGVWGAVAPETLCSCTCSRSQVLFVLL